MLQTNIASAIDRLTIIITNIQGQRVAHTKRSKPPGFITFETLKVYKNRNYLTATPFYKTGSVKHLYKVYL
jgi:hypothetical protein